MERLAKDQTRRVNKKYDEKQIRYVLQNWKETTTVEIADHLKLEVQDVRAIANTLRATLMRNELNPYEYLPKKATANFSLYEKVVHDSLLEK